MTKPLRILLLLSFVALLFALPVSQAAAKDQPCWRTLLDDWYDGVVDDAYPLACYTETLAHLRDYEDISTYSTAREDIARAKQLRIAQLRKERADQSDQKNEIPLVVPPSNNNNKPPGSFTDPTGPLANESGPKQAPTKVGLPGTKTQGRQEDTSPVGSAINTFGPDSADSLPVPLLVLGGLAGLLMLAGGAGYLARRAQSRRMPPMQPAPVQVESPRQ